MAKYAVPRAPRAPMGGVRLRGDERHEYRPCMGTADEPFGVYPIVERP